MSRKQTVEVKGQVKNGIARMIIAILSMALNVVIVVLIGLKMQDAWAWISSVLIIAGLSVVLYIYGRKQTASIKMPWMLLILLVPVGGLVFYLLVGHNHSTKKMRKRYEEIDAELRPLLPDNAEDMAQLKERLPYAATIAGYL